MKLIYILPILFLCSCDNSVHEEEGKIIPFFKLDMGNQDNLILYAEISLEGLDSIKSKYNWSEFKRYDNLLWEYMDVFFDDVVAKSKLKSIDELWLNLNRPQKVFWTFLAFEGETTNGGVLQFLINKEEHMFSALEVWKELEITRLENDYRLVLKEINGKGFELEKVKDKTDWEEKWNSFKAMSNELESAGTVKKYYHSIEFKKELFMTLCKYIEDNIEMFIKIETESLED